MITNNIDNRPTDEIWWLLQTGSQAHERTTLAVKI